MPVPEDIQEIDRPPLPDPPLTSHHSTGRSWPVERIHIFYREFYDYTPPFEDPVTMYLFKVSIYAVM